MNFQLKKPSSILKHLGSTSEKKESKENITQWEELLPPNIEKYDVHKLV